MLGCCDMPRKKKFNLLDFIKSEIEKQQEEEE